MTAGRAGRLRAAACLLAATVLILLAAKTCAKPVQRVAVVVAPGGDPLRAAAFANGAEFMLSQANGLEMPKPKTWQMITAEGKAEERTQYKGVGPVLYVTKLEPCEPPEEEVVTFNQ